MTLELVQKADCSRYRRASWPAGRSVFRTLTGPMIRYEKPRLVKEIMKRGETMVLVDYFLPDEDEASAGDWEPTS